MDNDIETVDPVEQCFEHFGILGMKWGRRRSTKELQAARGKKHWEGDSTKNSEGNSTKNSGKDSTEGSKTPHKETDNEKYQRLSRTKIQDMSTQEINDWVNRTNAINNYNRLTKEQQKANRSKGAKFASFVLNVAKEAGTEFARDEIKSMTKSGLTLAKNRALNYRKSK